MAKLSALSTSANVVIRFGPITVSCPWLAYNHYGKSEVALYVPNCPVGIIPTQIGKVMDAAGGSSTYGAINSYFGTPLDVATIIAIPYLLEDTVRKSLVPVRIYGGKSYDNRSIFAASSVECGSSAPSYFTLSSGSQWGSVFPTLNAKIKANNSMANFQMRGYLSGTHNYSSSGGGDLTLSSYAPLFLPQGVYIGYYKSASIPWIVTTSSTSGTTSLKVEGTIGDPQGFQKAINPSGAYSPSGGSNMNDMYIGGVSYDGIIMCLDGNCEVTGSGTSWTLSRGGAVESYRKIDGVWYRTV